MHLYIHVPFCARRCSYCDFAIAVRREVPTDDFVSSILNEWKGWQVHEAWEESPVVETIYFGGGTPSRLQPGGIARMLSAFAGDRSLAPDAEITLEANPDDVSSATAAAWRAAGVNRISLGVQSFEPAVLAWMHRTHTAEQVPAAVEAIRGAGIGDLSLDLIFALPATLARPWKRDLDRAMALGPDHLSLYGLTVEEHTPLGRWTASGRRRRWMRSDTRRSSWWRTRSWSLLATTTTRCRTQPCPGTMPATTPPTGGGRRSSGWAHRRTVAWAACGSGTTASGKRTTMPPRREGRSSSAGGVGPAEAALEEVYLGLRTSEGLPLARLPGPVAEEWTGQGWARIGGNRLILTAEGWLRLDALARAVS